LEIVNGSPSTENCFLSPKNLKFSSKASTIWTNCDSTNKVGVPPPK
jgi:hypothetical protein